MEQYIRKCKCYCYCYCSRFLSRLYSFHPNSRTPYMVTLYDDTLYDDPCGCLTKRDPVTFQMYVLLQQLLPYNQLLLKKHGIPFRSISLKVFILYYNQYLFPNKSNSIVSDPHTSNRKCWICLWKNNLIGLEECLHHYGEILKETRFFPNSSFGLTKEPL